MGAKEVLRFWEERNQEEHGEEKDAAGFPSARWELYAPPPAPRGAPGSKIWRILTCLIAMEVHSVRDPVQGCVVLEVKPQTPSTWLASAHFPVRDHSGTPAKLGCLRECFQKYNVEVTKLSKAVNHCN